ncbi:MAG: DUF3313 domain-containing protein [Pseudomonadaceae bacterium]|jgi:hypothetical protein|nr:DUF3313 domain-containing protein [Pseudomonadaceae bacterium]
MHYIRQTLVLSIAVVALAGCASTAQPGKSTSLGEDLQASGFLQDTYPLMTAGQDGEALRIYRNPKFASPAVFAQYTKVLLQPVQLYARPGSELHALTPADSAAIAKKFDSLLHAQLSKDYQLVSQPGPNTLEVAVAVVDAGASDSAMEAMSYVPIPLGLPGAKMAIMQGTAHTVGKPPFAGKVSIEGKLSDAQTGELIAAQIDVRVGARHPIIGLFESDTYDSWADVDEAGRYWVERLSYRLCLRRGGSNCVEASE